MKAMFKKSFAVFLSAILLLSVLPFTASAAAIIDSGATGDCTWTLDDEGTLTISGNGAMGDYAYSSSPWVNKRFTDVIIENGVTNIGVNAFSQCKYLKSISLSDSITSIGKYAFYNCSELASIRIPEGVTIIDNYTFRKCSNLTSVTLSAGLNSIGEYAFDGCGNLTGIIIPDSVTKIANCAFRSCSSLTSVCIPDSVTSIGWWVFMDCSNLATISGGNNATEVGYGSFFGTAWYEDLPNGLVYFGKTAYTYKGTESCPEHIDIKSGTVAIEYAAFQFCSRLKSIFIPDSVSIIGDSAFAGCTGLTSITIPNSVTRIGWSLFDGCSGLVTVSLPDDMMSIGMLMFYSCSSLTSVSIPRGVTSIEYSAFSGCTALTSIIIPDGVTSIGAHAFEGCLNLTDITVPDTVTHIGEDAFLSSAWYDNQPTMGEIIYAGKVALGYRRNYLPYNTYAEIKSGTIAISDGAFSYCSSLEGITISDSVKTIGSYAFEGCTNLTNITIPNSVTKIGMLAFSGCSGLKSLIIPNGVLSIERYAFSGCRNITYIVIPESVAYIGQGAFRDCSGLIAITVDPNNIFYDSRNNCNAIIETASNTLVAGCNKTIIPDSVTSIGDDAFESCDNLDSIVLPESVTQIGSDAFSYCRNLKSIFIPDSVIAIDNDAFWNSKKVTIYGISGSYAENYANQNSIPFVAVTDYGTTGDCLWWLDSAGTLTVSGNGKMGNYPNSLSLPWGTDRVKTAVFEDGVTGIGKCAFKNNSGLESVTIPGSVTAINGFAFYGCTSLQTITIRRGVTSIGDSAFGNCNDLTICGVKGSYAERYAIKNNIPFVAVCPSCGSTETEVVPATEASDTQNGATEGLRCKHCGEWILEPTVIAKTEQTVDSGTTGDCTWKLDSAGTLTVSGSGKMGDYPNSLNLPWSNNKVKVVILEDGVTSIGKCAFKNNKGLKSVTIPDSVTAINSFAFYCCSSLKIVTIPSSVTSIGISSFSYCDDLIIFGEKGSYAESYAAQNGIPFVPVCPFCGGSDFEAVPGSTSEMRCTHCGDGVVMPAAAPMGAVYFTAGDISGNDGVDIEDATLLQQCLADMTELDLEDEITFLKADMNRDGYVDVKDVTEIQRKVAEFI